MHFNLMQIFNKDFCLQFTKKNFDISEGNSKIKKFCEKHNFTEEKTLECQLIVEEFLSNILFPNIKDENSTIKLSLKQTPDKQTTLICVSYEGENYMTKINEQTIVSIKILQKKSKNIDITTAEKITEITFSI